MTPQGRMTTAVAIVGCFAAMPAFADPIVIRSGDLFADHFDPQSGPPISVNLAGDGGFTLSIGGFFVAGTFGPVDTCGWPTFCSPGTSVSVAAHLSGANASGKATLGGVTYSNVGGSNVGDPQVSLLFSGPHLIAPDRFEVAGPFSFSGTFSFIDAGGVARTEQLVGRGRVRLSFHPDVLPPGVPTSLDLVAAHYEFADPIPEPASLLLVGTGVAWVAQRLRRRRN